MATTGGGGTGAAGRGWAEANIPATTITSIDITPTYNQERSP